MPTPNYLEILLRIRDKEVVPFFGAGASMAPPVPDPAALYAPSARALSSSLARKLGLTDPELASEITDLAKVTAYGDLKQARKSLRHVLRQELGKDLAVGPIHKVTAELAPYIPLIVTTNYDVLLEKAMAGRPHHLVVQGSPSDDPPGGILWWPPDKDRNVKVERCSPLAFRELDPASAQDPIIYKMHGSLLPQDQDSFVISEGDYVEFLYRMIGNAAIPPFFADYLRTRSLLFLGYSLSDWNVRLLFRNVFFDEQSKSRTPHWAINLKINPLEALLWEERGIDVFEMTLDDFAAGLKQEMQGIN